MAQDKQSKHVTRHENPAAKVSSISPPFCPTDSTSLVSPRRQCLTECCQAKIDCRTTAPVAAALSRQGGPPLYNQNNMDVSTTTTANPQGSRAVSFPVHNQLSTRTSGHSSAAPTTRHPAPARSLPAGFHVDQPTHRLPVLSGAVPGRRKLLARLTGAVREAGPGCPTRSNSSLTRQPAGRRRSSHVGPARDEVEKSVGSTRVACGIAHPHWSAHGAGVVAYRCGDPADDLYGQPPEPRAAS